MALVLESAVFPYPLVIPPRYLLKEKRVTGFSVAFGSLQFQFPCHPGRKRRFLGGARIKEGGFAESIRHLRSSRKKTEPRYEVRESSGGIGFADTFSSAIWIMKEDR